MKSKWIWAAIIIGLALRILTLNNALSFDEYTQAKAVMEANPAGLDKYTEMNPLTTWTRIALTSVLGLHIWSLRLASLIFAILTGVVLYLLAKELYGKKTAVWAVVLLALSAWHALVSTSVSFDGTFMVFYTLLTLYCFVRYEKYSENKWLVFSGIAFGLTVLTKYPGVLVIFAIALYSLIKNRSIKKTIKECFIISIVGFGVYLIFPVVAFLTDMSYFWASWHHGSYYFGGREINIVLLLIQYALALLWAGPLLLFTYLLSWKERKKQDWLTHSLVIVIFAFYTFVVQDPFRPVERYFTILLPCLCMLSAGFFVQIRKWKLFWIVFTAMLAVYYAVSFLPQKILAFYPKTNFISAVLSLKWNFLVPFTGDQGPVGLYISFLVFAVAFIASLVCFVMSFKYRKAIVVLLAVGLAVSVFMTAELGLHIASPDISRVTKEAAEYAKTLPGPYFIFRDYGMQYYLGKDAVKLDFGTDPDSLKLSNSTLVVVDFPMLGKESKLWKRFMQCEQKKAFSSKGLILGYVFAC